MDHRRFDTLTRSVAAPKSRRGFLGGLAALGAGLLGARATDAQVTQAACGNVSCRAKPGVCKAGCVCCVYPNGTSRCMPPGACRGVVTACPAGSVTCADGECADADDPTNCGCGRERCPVGEACVAGACTCVGLSFGPSAAPGSCCARGNSYCIPGVAGAPFLVAGACDPDDFGLLVQECPPGYRACVGTACQACCPPGATCDPRGFCRQ